jgi:hypothetical protein
MGVIKAARMCFGPLDCASGADDTECRARQRAAGSTSDMDAWAGDKGVDVVLCSLFGDSKPRDMVSADIP